MTLILLHSPKGGVGNTFLTAQLSLALATRGHEVTALDFTFQDSLKLHMGFPPEQVLPRLPPNGGDPLVTCGVSVRQGHADAALSTFREALKEADQFRIPNGRVYIADLPSDDRDLLDIAMRHCALHICTLTPTADALATLPRLGGDKPVVALEKTVFVLNQLDDRHRLSRHADGFMREALGDQLIGRIRRDEAVNEALARLEPLAKCAPHSAALPDLAQFALAVERRLALPSPTERAEAAE